MIPSPIRVFRGSKETENWPCIEEAKDRPGINCRIGGILPPRDPATGCRRYGQLDSYFQASPKFEFVTLRAGVGFTFFRFGGHSS